MAEETAQGRPGDGQEVEGEWLPIATAARRLGISPKAIRGRIERRTIAWKQDGNRGRLVLVQPWDGPRDAPGEDEGEEHDEDVRQERDQLQEELGEARVRIGRLEEQVKAAQAVAVADVATAEAKVEARDMVIAELKEMLAEARRPWWRRWLS